MRQRHSNHAVGGSSGAVHRARWRALAATGTGLPTAAVVDARSRFAIVSGLDGAAGAVKDASRGGGGPALEVRTAAPDDFSDGPSRHGFRTGGGRGEGGWSGCR